MFSFTKVTLEKNRDCLKMPTDAFHIWDVLLNTGAKMPTVGFGTSQAVDACEAVATAISAGYRHIDCAIVYENEAEVGKGIQRKISDGTVTRGDLFITDKLWCTFHAPEHVRECLLISLKNLQLDYLDLYLIHWPCGMQYIGKEVKDPRYHKDLLLKPDDMTTYIETWRAMEVLLESRLVKAIGVCNFNMEQLQCLVDSCSVIPAVQQIECHPYLSQDEMIRYCQDKGIVVTSYSPFASPGRTYVRKAGIDIFKEPILLRLSKRHKKSVAQIVLRYLIQLGTTVIPKSSSLIRMNSNLDVFDFALGADDMRSIKSLNSGRRVMPQRDIFLQFHKDFPFHVNDLIPS